MKPITDAVQIEHYGKLVREMMLSQPQEECEFSLHWINSRGWKVVPVESMARIPEPDIPRIVSVLKGAGYRHCIAVFNESGYARDLPVVVASEPPSDMATSYVVSVDEADFNELNRELGPFRFLLTSEDRSWAISCSEWYNLFASKPAILEKLLGRPIDRAQKEFLDFALTVAKGNPDDPILRIAKRYSVA